MNMVMNDISMEEVRGALSDLIGQIVWSVHRGHGTSITMEFGAPHLSVREPIIASSNASSKVKELLARRRVFVEGDWHLLAWDAEWSISVGDKECGMNHRNDVQARLLEKIDGQIVKSILLDEEHRALTIDFDLGGRARILRWPGDIAADCPIWSLSVYKGDLFFINNDGSPGVQRR